MLLNNLDQAFVISIDYNWFYPEVIDKWLPILQRMYLPYVRLEDFFNAQIQSINFPGVTENAHTQRARLYDNNKRVGYQLDQIVDKSITLTLKTTESYISYFVARHQFDLFLRLGDVKPLYFPPITVSLLDDGGFETISYCYQQITPLSLSDLSMSYAARLGQFNTFTWSFKYNYYDVYMKNEKGVRQQISHEYDPNKDGIIEILDLDNPKYTQHENIHPGISAKTNMRKLRSTLINTDLRNY